MGSHYLNDRAISILNSLKRPGQSFSGVIIEYLDSFVKGSDEKK